MSLKRRSRNILVGLLVCAGLPGCVSGITADPVTEQCANPIQGSRFAVCGRLTTTGLSPAQGPSRAIGSVDSTHARVTNRYQLQGGTFHAYR